MSVDPFTEYSVAVVFLPIYVIAKGAFFSPCYRERANASLAYKSWVNTTEATVYTDICAQLPLLMVVTVFFRIIRGFPRSNKDELTVYYSSHDWSSMSKFAMDVRGSFIAYATNNRSNRATTLSPSWKCQCDPNALHLYRVSRHGLHLSVYPLNIVFIFNIVSEERGLPSSLIANVVDITWILL